jgi:hypothetical protein
VSPTLLEASARPEGQTLSEPIMGWRVWTLRSDRRTTSLRLHPIAGDAQPWPPLEPARAGCTRRRWHRGPELTCTCGLHATRDPGTLYRARNPAVVGTVALWGRVVEHEFGYRGEWAYPQRLMLVCHLCFWLWGPNRSSTHQVVVLRGGRLVPLCAEHVQLSRRYGYPLRRFAGANEVEGVLLSTYAVDPLRA